MTAKSHVVYCTRSPFKKQEWEAVRRGLKIGADGKSAEELFEIEFREVETSEPLLCDVEQMVRAKAVSAYRNAKVPCIVEHAGLILSDYANHSYPGGLTQPMWDALGAEKFASACRALGERAIARAVIGYCDGMAVKTFIGDTEGSISANPRGTRAFYWDTVFCPNGLEGKTYAEVAGESKEGLLKKLGVSQSIKALTQFLNFRLCSAPPLFPGA